MPAIKKFNSSPVTTFLLSTRKCLYIFDLSLPDSHVLTLLSQDAAKHLLPAEDTASLRLSTGLAPPSAWL